MQKRLLRDASRGPLSYTRDNDKYLHPQPVRGSSCAPTEGSAALTRYGGRIGGTQRGHFPAARFSLSL